MEFPKDAPALFANAIRFWTGCEKKRPEGAAFPLGMNFTQALSTIFLTASLALPTAS